MEQFKLTNTDAGVHIEGFPSAVALTTASAAVRDAYVQASGRALIFYPGALEAYDRIPTWRRGRATRWSSPVRRTPTA